MKKILFHLMLAAALFSFVQVKAQQTALSDKEKNALVFMYEEEKLARDVYDSMYAKWQVNPFGHIRNSERMHLERVGELVKQYGLFGPMLPEKDMPGTFNNATLQQLYTTCVTNGTLSLNEAYKAGALIEETDIRDLEDRLQSTDKEDIRKAFRYLEMGSENHLRAFTRNLTCEGITYEPVVMEKDAYQAILKDEPAAGCGEMEPGNKKCGAEASSKNCKQGSGKSCCQQKQPEQKACGH